LSANIRQLAVGGEGARATKHPALRRQVVDAPVVQRVRQDAVPGKVLLPRGVAADEGARREAVVEQDKPGVRVGFPPEEESILKRDSLPTSAPNQGLQATANSLRSCLAAAIGGA
jgi:hypothetical protein